MRMGNHFLLCLLQDALWQTPCSAQQPPPSNQQWHELMMLAVQNEVEAIVFDTVAALPDTHRPDARLLEQWELICKQTERNFRACQRVLGWIAIRMEKESDLKPIVLKGETMACCYPQPQRRTQGDIDLFYGSVTDCEKANRLLEQWGMKVIEGEQGEAAFMVNETAVEQHAHLMLTHDFLRKQAIGRLAETAAKAPTLLLPHPSGAYQLTAELNLTHVLFHSLTHTLNEGPKLKQLADVAMTLKHHYGHMDSDKLAANIDACGLKRWANLVFGFAVETGMQANMLPYDIRPARRGIRLLMNETTRPKTSMSPYRRILRNTALFGLYAPTEATGWMASLAMAKLKKKINKTTI